MTSIQRGDLLFSYHFRSKRERVTRTSASVVACRGVN